MTIEKLGFCMLFAMVPFMCLGIGSIGFSIATEERGINIVTLIALAGEIGCFIVSISCLMWLMSPWGQER